MSETTIEWTTTYAHVKTYPGMTFNPWQGCTKVSEACKYCYAATIAERWGKVKWGPKAKRVVASDKAWREPLRWNRRAKKLGIQLKVFCASMADIFEKRRELDEQRERLWKLIEETPHLVWLLLTKRPENIMGMIPARWRKGLPKNVWIGATVENQARANERVPHLLNVPAVVRFLSCEPLLQDIDLEHLPVPTSSRWHGQTGTYDALRGRFSSANDNETSEAKIHWVITGGESGAQARMTHHDWFRRLQSQCAAADVAFFHKQNGTWGAFVNDTKFVRNGHETWKNAQPYVNPDGSTGHMWVTSEGVIVNHTGEPHERAQIVMRMGKKRTGATLDGKLYRAYPKAA